MVVSTMMMDIWDRVPEARRRRVFSLLFMMIKIRIEEKENRVLYAVQKSASSGRVLQTENRETLPLNGERRRKYFFIKH